MLRFMTRPTGWANFSCPFIGTSTTVMKFPAGEVHIKGGDVYDEVAVITEPTSDDIIAVRLWADIRSRLGFSKRLVLPYLPHARQDKGLPLSAAVVAEILNAGQFDVIACLDPHSEVMPALLTPRNLIIVRQYEIPDLRRYFGSLAGVIAPDAGAQARAFKVGQVLGVPTYQGLKRRNQATGELSGFHCEPLPTGMPGRFLVVDDICDGGGTFVGLAEEINLPADRLALFVTHGVFSQGYERLGQKFSDVYTTNSFDADGLDREKIKITRIPVMDFLIRKALEAK